MCWCIFTKQKPIYNKSRALVRKKGYCKGCGAKVPVGRISWCCSECYNEFDPTSVRRNTFKRDGYKCTRCGSKQNLEADHIIPFSEGGITHISNMRTLCSKCHKIRTAFWKHTKKKPI